MMDGDGDGTRECDGDGDVACWRRSAVGELLAVAG